MPIMYMQGGGIADIVTPSDIPIDALAGAAGDQEAAQRYQQEIQDRIDYENKKRTELQRGASALSAIGNVLQMTKIPHAATVGTVLQIPDAIFDLENLVDNFNIKNAIHLGLDSSVLPVSIPILDAGAIADDGYSAITGRDLIEDLQTLYKNGVDNTQYLLSPYIYK